MSLTAEYLIEFAEEQHFYFVNGERKLSTTQVLVESGVIDLQWFNEYVRWRGSTAHAVIKDCLSGNRGSLKKADGKIVPYVEAALKFCKDRKFTPARVEHRMYDSILDICGTLDALGCINGGAIDTIVDWKTNDHGQIGSWVKLQTASYGHMLDPKAIFRRLGVILGGDGDYCVEPYTADTYLEHVNDFQALLAGIRTREKYL